MLRPDFAPVAHKHKPLTPTWRSQWQPYYWRLSKSQHTWCPGEGRLANTSCTQAKKRRYASSLLALGATQTKNWIHKETELAEDHNLPQQPARHPQSRQGDLSSVPAWVWASHETRHHVRHLVPTNPRGVLGWGLEVLRFIRLLSGSRTNWCLTFTSHVSSSSSFEEKAWRRGERKKYKENNNNNKRAHQNTSLHKNIKMEKYILPPWETIIKKKKNLNRIKCLK